MGVTLEEKGKRMVHLITSLETIACGIKVTPNTRGSSNKKEVTCPDCLQWVAPTKRGLGE